VSSTGLDANLAGMLCYLLGFLTGVLFLVIERDSRFVRFHAYQSLLTFGAVFVISVGTHLVPLIGPLVGFLLPIVTFAVWVVLMVQAFRGRRFKLPWVGDWAEGESSTL
jgi:uncharacterized membrane protein